VQVVQTMLQLGLAAGWTVRVLASSVAQQQMNAGCSRSRVLSPDPLLPSLPQRDLEGISDSLRIPGSKSLGPIARVRSWRSPSNVPTSPADLAW
jgi:hypothetical protein